MSTSKHTSLFGWLKALRLCSGFGGNLLSIADESEMKFVNSLPLELKNDSAWIGLLYRFRKGGYLWSDGTPFNYSVYINWLASFDKQSNSSEIQCVELLRNGWNLTDCYQENQYYICERPKGESELFGATSRTTREENCLPTKLKVIFKRQIISRKRFGCKYGTIENWVSSRELNPSSLGYRSNITNVIIFTRLKDNISSCSTATYFETKSVVVNIKIVNAGM